MKEKEQLNEYSGHVLITPSITNFRVCSMLIEAKGGGRWGKPMAATMGCPLPKWNGERVGWEATGLCLLTGRDDPGTGGTGDGNRRGSVGGGLNGMAWAEERAVFGSCMLDSMTSPLRKMKGKHRWWESTGQASSPAPGIHAAALKWNGEQAG
jgi:hypothetical protein